jgi:hypothetical protein
MDAPCPVRATSDPVWLDGYVAGRSIRVRSTNEQLEIDCRNTAGEIYVEHYDRTLVDDELFLRACNQSQRLLRRPFCQILRPHPVTGGRQLWGYDRGAVPTRVAIVPDDEVRCEYAASSCVLLVPRTLPTNGHVISRCSAFRCPAAGQTCPTCGHLSAKRRVTE